MIQPKCKVKGEKVEPVLLGAERAHVTQGKEAPHCHPESEIDPRPVKQGHQNAQSSNCHLLKGWTRRMPEAGV